MNNPLAIVAPQVGARSETFIRRHMQDLLPGGTVVVTNTVDGAYAGYWSVDCPVLALNQAQLGRSRPRGLHFIARKVGLQRVKDPIFVAIKHFLEENKVQMILGEYLNYSFPFFQIAQKLGIPYFAHAHGSDVSAELRNPKWQTEYLDYNQAAGVITMSQVSRKKLIELGLEATKIHVIPYGVDVPDKPLRRTENKTIRCLAVGRMVSKKAPILLLDAFRRATEVCPNLQLDYIGTGSLLPAVQQFIQAFSLTNKVTLHGGQPSEVVYQFMRDADIFLQHSITDPDTGDEEGLPVAILEAMAHALPLVSTRHAGIPEAVLDQETGFLVDEGDSFNMAQKILLLATDPGTRSKIGFAGWQRSKKLFTWECEKNNLLKLMQIST